MYVCVYVCVDECPCRANCVQLYVCVSVCVCVKAEGPSRLQLIWKIELTMKKSQSSVSHFSEKRFTKTENNNNNINNTLKIKENHCKMQKKNFHFMEKRKNHGVCSTHSKTTHFKPIFIRKSLLISMLTCIS